MTDGSIEYPKLNAAKSAEVEALCRYLYKQAETLNLALDSLRTLENKVKNIEERLTQLE